MTALLVENLSVAYGKELVLDNINFTVPKGKLVALIGPNGAGKTSLLKAILGLIPIYSGKIEILEGSWSRATRKKSSYLPQKEQVAWDFPITVFDLVLMGRYPHLRFLQWPSKKDKELALKYLKIVALDHLVNRQISELSGGEQQRAFMARALAQEATLYFMDEPFTGVDAYSKEILCHILQKLRDEGKTIFVVQHDLNSVLPLFDWTVLLNKKLVASGRAETVFTPENIQKTFSK